MLKEKIKKNLLVRLTLIFSKFISSIDFQVRYLLIALFTTLFSVTLWKLRSFKLDQLMSLTRRKPVLELTNTVPFNIINKESLSVSGNTAPFIQTPTEPPKKFVAIKPVNVLAKSYIVYDMRKEKIISEKSKNLELPPASLVKLLSVMVFTKNSNLNTYVLVPFECTTVNGQKLGFKAGEKVSIKDLLYSSLIYSAADSVCTLSKTNSELDLAYFNSYAKKIGMKSSNFTNYIGLDFLDNKTTAEDILVMTKEFVKNDLFNSIVKLKTYKLENGKVIYNTNKMLFENKYSIGIKTGTTGEANENLIYRYLNESENEDLLIIILNSSNRYQDARNIISSIYLATE